MIRTDLIAPIGELVRRQAERRPNALAFRDVRRSLTYGELAERTGRIAVDLQQKGVQAGDRVGLHLPNSVDWVEACIGIVRAGAVAVPISFEATPDEVAYRLSDAQCVAVFSRPDHIGPLQTLCDAHALKPRLIATENGGGDPIAEKLDSALDRPRDPADIDAAAFIVYTSGTTGKAKGVLLSLGGMLWVTGACWAPALSLGHDDYILNSLPLYHSYALNLIVVSALATGASAYLMEHFSTSQIEELMRQEPFTVLPGVPTVFHYILQRAKDEERSVLGKIRLCVSAGAVLPGTLNQEFETRFGVKLLDGYGITETSTMVTINWPRGGRVMGSCGLPLPGLATRIVDANEADVDPGAEGELIVRGPNVMLGYHNKPLETAQVLRNGWYHTGDIARSDRHGFLTITGRLKEIIIRGGQNIAPAEVEEVVLTIPAVLDCAVAGVPHAHLGEVPVAFVIPRPGLGIDPTAILEHCRARLSAYKVPQSIHFLETIPRTGSGKVLRYKLRDLFTQQGTQN